jgi:hypothetical protein
MKRAAFYFAMSLEPHSSENPPLASLKDCLQIRFGARPRKDFLLG